MGAPVVAGMSGVRTVLTRSEIECEEGDRGVHTLQVMITELLDESPLLLRRFSWTTRDRPICPGATTDWMREARLTPSP